MATVLDGKALAKSIESELSARVETLKQKQDARQFWQQFWWAMIQHQRPMYA